MGRPLAVDGLADLACRIDGADQRHRVLPRLIAAARGQHGQVVARGP